MKIFKEIKRIFFLSIHVYKVAGFSFLLREVIRYVKYGPAQILPDLSYEDFRKKYEKKYTKEEVSKLLTELQYQPLITIVIPVYNVSPKWLNLCISSVKNQLYPKWELCIYDDCSTNNETINFLKEIKNSTDSRINIEFGKKNGHISFATNKAVSVANGEFVGFLDNDDELTEDALLENIITLNKNRSLDLLYSDEDFINPEGQFCNPHFKSDFNRELLLSHNYITHFVLVRKQLGESIGWFRIGLEGAQDHDFILRVCEISDRIHHIPKVLYHWRMIETSTASNYSTKSYADASSRKALQDYAFRNNIYVEILPGPGAGAYRFKRNIETKGLISIIIPFRDQVKLLCQCIDSIFEKTDYQNYELILISNNSSEKSTFKYLEELKKKDDRIKVFEYNIPFNFSKINNWAVNQSQGEFILLLNNDTKIISKGWLGAMLEHIQDPNCGIVGAKLIYEDNTIQHAGVIVGISGIAGHSHRHFPKATNGYYYRPSVTQNLTAVTGACLLTKRSIWNEVNGLDEENFKIAFNDIDYCLKVRQKGYDVVYTPYAELYHYESKSRGYEDSPEKKARFEYESELLNKKWGTKNYRDPFYNENLTLNFENFGLKV